MIQKKIADSILESYDIKNAPSKRMQQKIKTSIILIKGVRKEDIDTVKYIAAALDCSLTKQGEDPEVYENGYSVDSINAAVGLFYQAKANEKTI